MVYFPDFHFLSFLLSPFVSFHFSNYPALLTFLCVSGYFRYLRALLNARVPSSLEPSPSPPTPLAAAIRDLVMNPLQLTKDASNGGENVLNVKDR